MEDRNLKSTCQLIQFPGEGPLSNLKTDGHLRVVASDGI